MKTLNGSNMIETDIFSIYKSTESISANSIVEFAFEFRVNDYAFAYKHGDITCKCFYVIHEHK